jgi:NhaP-type Na+/H+ or K+/H+ antiporter
MDLQDPALTFAIALAAGIVAQSAARHLQIPGIVLLLAVGVLLGPDVANLVRPSLLGDQLHRIVGIAVAVVLFEGGLNLSLERLRREAQTIRRLITVGVLVTAAGGGLAAWVFMGWDWRAALLFGTLVVVTGPTVVTPILRRFRVKRNVSTILEAEGVLIDPIGAIVAVVALEAVIASTTPGESLHLVGLPQRLGLGLLLGAGGGLVIGLLLRFRPLVPEGLENVVTLALVLVLFEISDSILAESGIMAAAVAGLVVGNMETPLERELKEFKEQITVLLIGLLFVLLSADVRVAEVVNLGWPGLATVAALVLLVRPLAVAACTAGSDLDVRERAFLAWLAPRGIVAAAVASLFGRRMAEQGLAGGDELVGLVFLVIAVTVLVQGIMTGHVASRLGLSRRENRGYLLVGANAVGRALARVLSSGGEEVVLVDSNAAECQAAEARGFDVVFGNAADDRTLLQADVEGRRGLVAVTPNGGVNLLLVQDVGARFSVAERYVALPPQAGVRPIQVHDADASVLFGVRVDMEEWIHRLLHGTAVLQPWRYHGDGDGRLDPTGDGRGGPGQDLLLPLAVERDGGIRPVDDRVELLDGDVVHFAWARSEADAARSWLEERDWVPEEAREEAIT